METITEQDKCGVEQLAKYLDIRTRNEEKNIRENQDKLDRDHLYYLAWNREDLFKSHFTTKQYGELQQVTRQAKAPGEAYGYIRYKWGECLKELVNGGVHGHNANDIFNLIHTYRLEYIQGLVRDYTGSERLLSMRAPQKEMKMKKDSERKKPDGLEVQRT